MILYVELLPIHRDRQRRQGQGTADTVPTYVLDMSGAPQLKLGPPNGFFSDLFPPAQLPPRRRRGRLSTLPSVIVQQGSDLTEGAENHQEVSQPFRQEHCPKKLEVPFPVHIQEHQPNV